MITDVKDRRSPSSERFKEVSVIVARGQPVRESFEDQLLVGNGDDRLKRVGAGSFADSCQSASRAHSCDE